MPKIQILQKALHAAHLLKLLDKMYKYEMDPTRTVRATERARDAGRTDGRSETKIPPTTSLCGGIIKMCCIELNIGVGARISLKFGIVNMSCH